MLSIFCNSPFNYYQINNTGWLFSFLLTRNNSVFWFVISSRTVLSEIWSNALTELIILFLVANLYFHRFLDLIFTTVRSVNSDIEFMWSFKQNQLQINEQPVNMIWLKRHNIIETLTKYIIFFSFHYIHIHVIRRMGYFITDIIDIELNS